MTEDSQRIWAERFGRELWIAPDRETATWLAGQADGLPVLTFEEVTMLADQTVEWATRALDHLALVQRSIPGARLIIILQHAPGWWK